MKKLSVIFATTCLTFTLGIPAAFAAKTQHPAKHNQDLLKKYDKNGDGKLDAKEKAAARKDRKKEAAKHAKKSAKHKKPAETPAQ